MACPLQVAAHDRRYPAVGPAVDGGQHAGGGDIAGADEAPAEGGVAHEDCSLAQCGPHDERTIKVGGTIARRGGWSGRARRSRRRRAAASPIRRGAIETVVSGGWWSAASAISSKPITAKSVPGARPASRRPPSTPKATTSLWH